MKQVVLRIEDAAYEKFRGFIQLCPSVEVVDEDDFADTEIERDLCMKQAIITLRQNKVFRHYYDYTWIMMAINEGHVSDFDVFKSPQVFIDYLYEIGIDQLPTRYTLSLAYSKALGTYPDWTFLDVEKPNEILRRKNVVKQFLSAYGAAKRGFLNNKFNK